VCIWCWHRLRDSESGCPACRHAYPSEPYQFAAKSSAQPIAVNAKGKSKGKKKKKTGVVASNPTAVHSSTGVNPSPQAVQAARAPSPLSENSPLAPTFDRAVGASRGQRREQQLAVADKLPSDQATREIRVEENSISPMSSKVSAVPCVEVADTSGARPQPTRDRPLEEVMAFLALAPATCTLLLDEDFDTECVLDSTVHDFESIGLPSADAKRLLQWADCNR